MKQVEFVVDTVCEAITSKHEVNIKHLSYDYSQSVMISSISGIIQINMDHITECFDKMLSIQYFSKLQDKESGPVLRYIGYVDEVFIVLDIFLQPTDLDLM